MNGPGVSENPLAENSDLPVVVRIGTRGSPLARWQADHIQARLSAAHPAVRFELVEIRTHGDKDRESPLVALGGTGLFTKEIQHALLDGRVDLAVHSLKDLPTQGPDDLILAAVPLREHVGDALIAPRWLTLANLPPGSRIGTGSLRRQGQLLHMRPDLEVVGVRGNVETRLRLALDGKLDAVVLAAAGLRRLNRADTVTEALDPPAFLPAIGQGALGIECRRDHASVQNLLACLNDPVTHASVLAERALLADLEAGCMIPLAGWCRLASDDGADALVMDAMVCSPDGRALIRTQHHGSLQDPVTLGRETANLLRAQGAEAILRGH